MATFDALPEEIIVEIFKNLSLEQMVGTELVCRRFKSIIRSTKWAHVVVKLYYDKHISHVVDTYQFMNYDFQNSDIMDDTVKKTH